MQPSRLATFFCMKPFSIETASCKINHRFKKRAGNKLTVGSIRKTIGEREMIKFRIQRGNSESGYLFRNEANISESGPYSYQIRIRFGTNNYSLEIIFGDYFVIFVSKIFVNLINSLIRKDSTRINTCSKSKYSEFLYFPSCSLPCLLGPHIVN